MFAQHTRHFIKLILYIFNTTLIHQTKQIISQSNTTAIFINQLRDKIGVFFGSPETTTGGKALKFYASIRLDVRRIETLKQFLLPPLPQLD